MRTGLFMAVLALGAGTAHADNGFIYVGAGVSKDKLSNIAPSGGLADIDKTSWKVLAGLRPVSVFAVEADYLDLGSQTSAFVGGTSRSEERRVGKECGYGWSPRSCKRKIEERR